MRHCVIAAACEVAGADPAKASWTAPGVMNVWAASWRDVQDRCGFRNTHDSLGLAYVGARAWAAGP